MRGKFIQRREDKETGLMVLICDVDSEWMEVPVNAATYQSFADVPKDTGVRINSTGQGPYAAVVVLGAVR